MRLISSRVFKSLLGLFPLILSILLLFPQQIIYAQSPAPSWRMEDVYPGYGSPSGANAVIVEGEGSLGCSFSESSIEQQTATDVNDNLQTVTEIMPQATCGSLSQYESLLSNITSYVESHTSNPGRYWAGLMLDEEPGYGFSASNFEALNAYTYNAVVNTPGMSLFFTENQPNGWPTQTYAAINGYGTSWSTWPAPQAYTQSMVNAINTASSKYNITPNLVTIDTYNAYPWNSASYVTGLVNGSPWSNGYWGNGYWYNLWQYGT
ncbi:MAG TPA: hypothetical protein DD856_04825 [Sulfobacillus sp.]|nr:hypothetical protein [Sulfobacillus sp.]